MSARRPLKFIQKPAWTLPGRVGPGRRPMTPPLAVHGPGRERRPPRASASCREAHMSPRHTDAPHPVPHVILSSCGPRVSVCSKKLHATNRNRSKRSERKAEARVEPKSGRHRTAPPATTAGGAEPFGVGVGVVEPCRGPAASRLGVGFLRACSLLLHSMAAGPAEP